MTDEHITPLRQRMIDDMRLRHFGEKTQHDYIRVVRNLTIFLDRSPDTATAEDLRWFQLHLTERRVRPGTINATVTALRFFFGVTLDRPDATKQLSFVHEPRRLPLVLSPQEVARFLAAAPGVKYKAAFSAAYGAGLRRPPICPRRPTSVREPEQSGRPRRARRGDATGALAVCATRCYSAAVNRSGRAET